LAKPDKTASDISDSTKMADSQGDSRKPSLGAELVIPLAALLFAIYYFFTIRNSPWTAQVGAFFIGTILIVLCLIFVVVTVLKIRSGSATAGFSVLLSREDYSSGRLAVFVLTLLYVVLIPYGGFTLTTFFFLWLCMAILGHGKKLFSVTLVASGITLSGYLLFIVAFNTRFPHGPFEALMDSLH